MLDAVCTALLPAPFRFVCPAEPVAMPVTSMVSFESPFRLSVGTARTGGGAPDADALGVFWEPSS